MRTLSLVCLTALALAGCATDSEPEFGSSVRRMLDDQTFDRAAPTDVVPATDGQRAARAIDNYRAGDTKKAARSGATSALIMPTTQ